MRSFKDRTKKKKYNTLTEMFVDYIANGIEIKQFSHRFEGVQFSEDIGHDQCLWSLVSMISHGSSNAQRIGSQLRFIGCRIHIHMSTRPFLNANIDWRNFYKVYLVLNKTCEMLASTGPTLDDFLDTPHDTMSAPVGNEGDSHRILLEKSGVIGGQKEIINMPPTFAAFECAEPSVVHLELDYMCPARQFIVNTRSDSTGLSTDNDIVLVVLNHSSYYDPQTPQVIVGAVYYCTYFID